MAKQLKPTTERPAKPQSQESNLRRSPLANAQFWISRVLTVSLEMVVPGLAGLWLDARWETSPWWTLAGFAVGLPVGLWHLLAITRIPRK